MACIVEDITFRSSCGRGKIYAKKWFQKREQFRGIIQISHDLNEHIGYYDAFAKQLSEEGYIVCANDHLGHGRSAITPLLTGYFGEQYGYLYLVEDMHTLMELMRKKYPELPYFFFAQGIGAYPVQLFQIEHTEPIRGLILASCTDKLPGSFWKRKITGITYHMKGSTSKYEFLNKLYYRPLCGNVKKTKAPWIWLSRNEKFVEEFTQDPACNFQLTNVGLRDIYLLEEKTSVNSWYTHFPKDTAVFLCSGTQDPLTHDGRNTQRIGQRLQKIAAQVQFKLYSDGRHALLQDLCKDDVTADIIYWLNAQV